MNRAVLACLSIAATIAHMPCRMGGRQLRRARSSTRTTALVELYTSEGCSSCPPANRQLGRLNTALDAGALAVPIALHVAYWDELGWRDPYAQRAFDERQRALARANGLRSVYTPGFFVSGVEARRWPQALHDEVRRVNARPATTTIRVQSASDGEHLAIDASASTPGTQASLLPRRHRERARVEGRARRERRRDARAQPRGSRVARSVFALTAGELRAHRGGWSWTARGTTHGWGVIAHGAGRGGGRRGAAGTSQRHRAPRG